MHPHQCSQGNKPDGRYGGCRLSRFADKLKEYAAQVEVAETFPELIGILRKARIKGVGELTVYDTAVRIAAARGIDVDAVYLHAGTRRGVKKVLGGDKIKGREGLPVDEFPSIF